MTAGASSPPPSVLDLVSERQAARERRDFARADALRDQVRAAGWMIRDTAAGADLVEAPEWEPLDPAATTPRWDEPDQHEVSLRVHVPRHGPGDRAGPGLARPARRGHRRPARPAAGRACRARGRPGGRLGRGLPLDAGLRSGRRPGGRCDRGLPARRAAPDRRAGAARPEAPLLPQRRPRFLVRRPRSARWLAAPAGAAGGGAGAAAPPPRLPRNRPGAARAGLQEELQPVPGALEAPHRPAHSGVHRLPPSSARTWDRRLTAG